MRIRKTVEKETRVRWRDDSKRHSKAKEKGEREVRVGKNRKAADKDEVIRKMVKVPVTG